MEISRLESMAFEALILREQEIKRQYLDPLQLDLQYLYTSIEERLSLTNGAIGTTHVINLETKKVEENVTNNTQESSS